jgi:hypothetical protein
MLGILTFIKRMTSLCLQSLQHRSVNWTKPSTTSLVLGTLTDLTRSKSELVAENALLRKPLIILRRHVKRPPCAKTDRILLVLLARMVRAWKQALFIVQPATDLALASSGIQTVLEIQVQSGCSQTKDSRRNRGIDQGDGEGQSTLGSGTDPRRVAQAGDSRLQAHDPEGHAEHSHASLKRAKLGDLPAHSCRADLGSLGPAISCTSPTCASVRSLRFSSLNCNRGRLSPSG